MSSPRCVHVDLCGRPLPPSARERPLDARARDDLRLSGRTYVRPIFRHIRVIFRACNYMPKTMKIGDRGPWPLEHLTAQSVTALGGIPRYGTVPRCGIPLSVKVKSL